MMRTLCGILATAALLLGGCDKGPKPKQSTCAEYKARISKQALRASACKQDADCSIVGLPVCSMKNIGCHFAALNPKRAKPLHAAVKAYLSANCIRTKCECMKRPTQARCQAERCVAVPAGAASPARPGTGTGTGLLNTAGLRGIFVTPTMNSHKILRLKANGTFSWSIWSHLNGGMEHKPRSRGTWKATGKARIALTVTTKTTGMQPPKALFALVANGQRVLVDEAYVRAKRQPPLTQGGEILIERTSGSKDVPLLILLHKEDEERWRKLLVSLELAP